MRICRWPDHFEVLIGCIVLQPPYGSGRIEQGYPFFVQEIDDTLLAESFLGFVGKMVFVIEE